MKTNTTWTAFEEQLRLYFRSRVSQTEDLEDLLQDTLFKIHQSLNGLQKEQSLNAWLYRIAHNNLVDYYRKKGSVSPEEPITLLEESEANTAHPLAEELRPFLKKLPQADQELLEAIYFKKQSQKAYAETLGIPYSTLKSRVHAARKTLRQLFEECCRLAFDSRGNLFEAIPRALCCKKD